MDVYYIVCLHVHFSHSFGRVGINKTGITKINKIIISPTAPICSSQQKTNFVILLFKLFPEVTKTILKQYCCFNLVMGESEYMWSLASGWLAV